MSDTKKTYWCEKCSKKIFLADNDCDLTVERSELQKKIPHLDVEKNKKSRPIFVQRKNFIKCKICGFLLKEIKNEKK